MENKSTNAAETTEANTTVEITTPLKVSGPLSFVTCSVRAVSRGGSCFGTIMDHRLYAGYEVFINASLGNAYDLQVGDEVYCAVEDNTKSTSTKFYARMIKPISNYLDELDQEYLDEFLDDLDSIEV